jgi:hypothetical protein
MPTLLVNDFDSKVSESFGLETTGGTGGLGSVKKRAIIIRTTVRATAPIPMAIHVLRLGPALIIGDTSSTGLSWLGSGRGGFDSSNPTSAFCSKFESGIFTS